MASPPFQPGQINAGTSLFTSEFRNAGLIAAFLPLLASATADPVKLKWDPNPETNLIRYEVHYGSRSGAYTHTIDVGMNTRASVSNLMEGTTYYFAVTAVSSSGLASEPSDELCYRPPPSNEPPPVIPRNGWSLRYTDSEERNGYAATRAFDGDTGTFWHTKWTTGVTPPPHEIQIDLGSTHAIGGFRYLPRQDEFLIGNIGEFGFFVSMDGIRWDPPAATGTFASTKQEKQVLFAPRYGRYLRLLCLSEANGNMDCNVAELNVLGSAASGSIPEARPLSRSTSENTPLGIVLESGTPTCRPLTFIVADGPTHGTVSGMPPCLVYTPEPGFTGQDVVSYRINDGVANTNTAVVAISVSPATGFNQWIGCHGLIGTPAGDDDHDSIPNAIEYLVGTNPADRTPPECLPSARMTLSGTSEPHLLYTYRRADRANSDPSATTKVEWSPDPAGPWTSAEDTPGIESEVLNDAAGAGIDVVNVRIPCNLSPGGKLFARLGITLIPD
jgi:hypothetical protein